MRVFRGRKPSIEADRAASSRLLERAASGESAVRVWIPHRQVAFGRRDSRLEGYGRAKAAARACGFPPVERSVGGRAVAYDGETTVAFARSEPVADFRQGVDERYDRLTSDVEDVLTRLGLEVHRGEPADSFCPGAHSLSIRSPEEVSQAQEAQKVVGIAQRVRSDAALVSGIVVVDNVEELSGVLEPVYRALEVPFTRSTVGSVVSGGGPSDPVVVRDALERALVGNREPESEDLSER